MYWISLFHCFFFSLKAGKGSAEGSTAHISWVRLESHAYRSSFVESHNSHGLMCLFSTWCMCVGSSQGKCFSSCMLMLSSLHPSVYPQTSVLWRNVPNDDTVLGGCTRGMCRKKNNRTQDICFSDLWSSMHDAYALCRFSGQILVNDPLEIERKILFEAMNRFCVDFNSIVGPLALFQVVQVMHVFRRIVFCWFVFWHRADHQSVNCVPNWERAWIYQVSSSSSWCSC